MVWEMQSAPYVRHFTQRSRHGRHIQLRNLGTAGLMLTHFKMGCSYDPIEFHTLSGGKWSKRPSVKRQSRGRTNSCGHKIVVYGKRDTSDSQFP